jgi:NAD(P)H-flavin reductase/hemoglobin-like flavoprotein
MAIALSGSYQNEAGVRTIAGQRLVSTWTASGQPGMAASLISAQVPANLAGSINANEMDGSERLATADDEARAYAADGADFDFCLVRESFAHIAASPSQAMEHFYSHLFVRYPDMRSMFPHAMGAHMEQAFASLERVVWSIDDPVALAAYLGQLGRDHRKFGVRERHYEPVLAVFLDTLRHFCGHYWTDATEAAWRGAMGRAASVMIAAARRDAIAQPAWWVGEVVRHDLRRPDLAVLTIRPDQPLLYTAGQFVSVQVPRWPRVWRTFSIANAPRGNGLLDLHVRAVPGGMVSGALTHHTAAGDALLLGQARGEMTPGPGADRDLVCIAGGTGLAPVKAIIEHVISADAAARSPRRIGLLFGARGEEDLYDLRALREIQSRYPALTVTPVVSGEPGFAGIRGTLAQAAARYVSAEGKDIFVSGPAEMIRATVSALKSRVAPGQIHHDDVTG